MNEERTRTYTKPLVAKNYLSNASDPANRQLNLTRLVDDAVEALGTIRNCGVGRQRGRSRCVILRSFRSILESAGYTALQAHETWRNQVMAIDELNAHAEE